MQKLKQKPCGKLDSFIISKESIITLEADPSNKGEFNVLIKKSETKLSPVLVSFAEAFQLNSELSQIMLGDTQISTEDDLKLILDEDEDPDITIVGKSDKLELRLSIFPTEKFDIFSDANIPIATPKIFTTDDTVDGQIESKTTLLSEGLVSFTEYPDIKPLSFKESDLIRFGKGGNFKIEQMKFIPTNDNEGGIKIRLRGTPTKLTINETVKTKNDRRLTYYETLEQDKFWQVVFNYTLEFLIGIMGLILVTRVKCL